MNGIPSNARCDVLVVFWQPGQFARKMLLSGAWRRGAFAAGEHETRWSAAQARVERGGLVPYILGPDVKNSRRSREDRPMRRAVDAVEQSRRRPMGFGSKRAMGLRLPAVGLVAARSRGIA